MRLMPCRPRPPRGRRSRVRAASGARRDAPAQVPDDAVDEDQSGHDDERGLEGRLRAARPTPCRRSGRPCRRAAPGTRSRSRRSRASGCGRRRRAPSRRRRCPARARREHAGAGRQRDHDGRGGEQPAQRRPRGGRGDGRDDQAGDREGGARRRRRGPSTGRGRRRCRGPRNVGGGPAGDDQQVRGGDRAPELARGAGGRGGERQAEPDAHRHRRHGRTASCVPCASR